LAAKAGDRAASEEVLKLWGYGSLITRGKPFSPKALRVIDVLTCPIGSDWEKQNADGLWENLVLTPPPPPGEKPREYFDNDED
jgi:hypothetical protein